MFDIKATEVNEEVFITSDSIAKVSQKDIEWLKAKALSNVRERVRLCTHQSVEDAVHEMLIVHTKGTYIRPHKHPNKSESFHIIEGALDIVVFDDTGGILEVVNMGEYSSGDQFFWRLSESHFHTVIPRTDIVVFHETTSGPFVRATSNVPAPWSPNEGDLVSIEPYALVLETLIRLRGSDDQTQNGPEGTFESSQGDT